MAPVFELVVALAASYDRCWRVVVASIFLVSLGARRYFMVCERVEVAGLGILGQGLGKGFA